MSGDPVEDIARALLYEGYVLWPYRRSAIPGQRGQRRWSFGGVYPAAFCEGAAQKGRSEIRCEAIVEGDDDCGVSVEVRFLHVVRRQALSAGPSGLRPVDRIDVGGHSHLSWDEATERRLPLGEIRVSSLREASVIRQIEVPAGDDLEKLVDDDGTTVGALRRTWKPIHARVRISAAPLSGRRSRIEARVANRSPWTGADRDGAQLHAMVSPHVVLHTGGAFHSLTDPDPEVAANAAACTNDGVWPVLVGPEGSRDTLLAAPVILEDYPRIDRESPGDRLDGSRTDRSSAADSLRDPRGGS